MRAGYAIPFLFPPVKFRGDWFADGGFAWNVPLDYALSLDPTEVYVLAPIASELPYRPAFRSFVDFAGRVADVLWRTIGNMGYIYAPIVNGAIGDVPVTVISPGEQWSGANPLMIFNAYPRKSLILMDAGYRDAQLALAARRRTEERDAPSAPVQRRRKRGARSDQSAAAEGEPARGTTSPPVLVSLDSALAAVRDDAAHDDAAHDEAGRDDAARAIADEAARGPEPDLAASPAEPGGRAELVAGGSGALQSASRAGFESRRKRDEAAPRARSTAKRAGTGKVVSLGPRER
jgi:predicted acylesterase/phospholipase RssA